MQTKMGWRFQQGQPVSVKGEIDQLIKELQIWEAKIKNVKDCFGLNSPR